MGGTGNVTRTVLRSPNDVFAFLSDIDRLPDWNAIITRVVERPERLEPGAEWVVELKAMGNSWPSRSKLEEFDTDRRVFAYRSATDDGNPSYALWRWTVEPAAEGMSRVTVSWDLHPQTLLRRALLVRIRAHELRREIPASIDSLARALEKSTF